MNVILISECTKKAAIQSRRILSRYARNIARRTWIATITEQGLAHLQQELLDIATKNTAVACHKVTTRNEIVLAWIVGSRHAFDEDGNFAFRYTEDISERYRIELSDLSHDTIIFFSLLNKLAGLFHDVGKNFHYFQYKLAHNKKGKEAGDPIRHEYLSFLSFFYLYDFKKEDYRQQLLALRKNINSVNTEALQNKLHAFYKKNKKGFLYQKLLKQSHHKFTLSKLLSHLIISHHRLIKGKQAQIKTQITINDDHYFNTIICEKNSEEIEKIFHLYKQQDFVLNDDKWKSQFDSTLERFILLYEKHNAHFDRLMHDENIVMSITHYLSRPALIMADQYVSGQLMDKKTAKAIQKNPPHYAKEQPIANFNQRLDQHLKWVGKYGFKYNKILWQSTLSNKRLYKTSVPPLLLKPAAKSLPQFHWQNAAVNALKTIDKTKDFGFFAVVMAKTGAGKTRANAKIMAALSDELRFSTLLGLRTLTLQTLDEYRDHLGMQKNDIIGIIGDQSTRDLHELDKKDTNTNENESGTENNDTTKAQIGKTNLNDFFADENEITLSDDFFNDVDTPFPKELCFSSRRDSKLDRISKIPVLVATIDYMIQGIDADRSSKTRFLTRLMTSDIIIDEIDSYNQNDLMAIHKVAYLVGFYGKKLVIASATLPELLIASFYRAYATGYQRFQAYADKQHTPLYMGLFSHIEHLNQVSIIEDNQDNASQTISTFVDQFYDAIQQEPVKRRASVLDISEFLHQDVKKEQAQYELLAPLYRTIIQAAEHLHTANHSNIAGIEVSTGLIKFNNTEDAFHFAHYLLNAEDLEQQSVVKIECYHARHFPIRRNYVEKQLSQLLNRKKGNHFKKLSLVKNAIKEAKQANKKRVLLVVVSTTIIEIGRDFDFDWGIIEPRSHWSIIQTVGRIMRHREKKAYDNVMLLSHSMRAVRSSKTSKQKLYSNPGVEMNDGKGNVFCLSEADKYQSVEQLFEYKAMSQKIDASITLKNQSGQPIKNLENQQLQAFTESQALGSLHRYLHCPLEYLSTFNSDQNPFRGGYQKQYIYQQNEHYKWEIVDKKRGTSYHAEEGFDTIVLRYPERCLITKSLAEIEEDYALKGKGIQLPREIYSLIALEKTKKYNEFLGVL